MKETNTQLMQVKKLFASLLIMLVIPFTIVFAISFFGRIQQNQISAVTSVPSYESFANTITSEVLFRESFYQPPLGSKVNITEHQDTEKAKS